MRRIAGIALGFALAGAAIAQDDAPLPAAEAALAAIDERPLVREALAMRNAADARAEALSVGTHEFLVGGGWHQRVRGTLGRRRRRRRRRPRLSLLDRPQDETQTGAPSCGRGRTSGRYHHHQH